ncbi:unnamed protein product, partial [marine sediment metagenome]
FSTAQILKKYKIQYFKCTMCGFIQTEDPYWLDESYSQAITESDLGLVSRNIALSRITKALILTNFDSNGKFLDYGGGYGLFVRIMRDLGFDFYWHDKFCQNIFAKGFEVDINNQLYELCVAFEILEHLAYPLIEIEKITNLSKNILFSTKLIPQNTPKPIEWWYYGLEHGQHISFYTFDSLSFIATKFGLNLYSNKQNIHLFTEEEISPIIFRLLLNQKITSLLDFILKKKSFISEDYYKITGNSLN